MRRYLRDSTFSRFDTIPECDRHTHTHTDTRRRHIPCLARRHAVKKSKLLYLSNGFTDFYEILHIGPPNPKHFSKNQTFKNARWRTAVILTSGSAIAEGPGEALVSINPATTKHLT